MQRSGRAGRSGSSAIAILLVEPYVFQLKKVKEQNTNEKKRKSILIKQEDVEDEVDSEYERLQHEDTMEDDDPQRINAMQLYDVDLQYRKKLKGGLRNWIDPQHCDCRREVSNTYFGNPPS